VDQLDAADEELQGEGSDGKPVLELPGSSAGPRPLNNTVKASNEELSKVRKKRKNTLDFSTWVYSDNMKSRELDCIYHAKQALIVWFKKGLSTHKTIIGNRDFHSELVKGNLGKVVTTTFGHLEDQGVLHGLQLLSNGRVSDTRAALDQAAAQLLADCVLRFSFDFSVYEFEWTHGSPGVFFRLIGDDQHAVTGALHTLSIWWEHLCTLESAMIVHPTLRAKWSWLSWPRSQWTREQMLRLAEAEFAGVPQRVKENFWKLAKCLLSTSPCENGGNKVRKAETGSQSKKMSSMTKWYCLLCSSIFADYERKPVTVIAAAEKSDPTTIAATQWRSKGHVHSLGLSSTCLVSIVLG